MDRPTKDEVLNRLRWFSKEMLEIARVARRDGESSDMVDAIDLVGWKATYNAERLLATGRDYLPPDAAHSLTELVREVEKIAEAISDTAVKLTVRAPGQALDAFVSKYSPTQTDSGKFMFRLDGDE